VSEGVRVLVGSGEDVLVGIGVTLATSVVGGEVAISDCGFPQAAAKMDNRMTKTQARTKRNELILKRYQPNLSI
jgi:hypothetical protein